MQSHAKVHTTQTRRLLTLSGTKSSTVIMLFSHSVPRRRSAPALFLRGISSSQLTIDRTPKSRYDQCPAKEHLQFGTTLSDHMLVMEWKQRWESPRIVPYQDLKISPAASCLHYGMQCFEGMKAYKDINNEKELRLFRPDMNMKRLVSSMDRLHLPGTQELENSRGEIIECLKELVRVDQKWIPYGEGYSLYIRPTVIATHPYLGVAPPESILFYIITSPVGPYYKEGFNPIKLTADTDYVRAWPGGTGNAKVGGNYGPTMKPAAEAAHAGYSQILWLFHDEVTEVGAMNLFFVLKGEDGRAELVTPPLTRGDILPGVTRDSILQLARKKWADELMVSERFPNMTEIAQAADEKRLLEAFGAGTAAVVTPISCIQYKGRDVTFPAPGVWTQRIWDEITGIQYGKIEGPDGWSISF